MKTAFFVFLLSLLAHVAVCQKNAVTETVEEVLLFDDGTWKFKNKEEAIEKEIPTNTQQYSKPSSSNFLLKSDRLKGLGFWLDSKNWSFKKAESNADAEYELQLKGGDLYGMIISEKMEIPLLTLKKIAFDNARSAASDIKVVKEEYRTVNGLKVLHLQMDGTLQGVKFSYFGYYYTSNKGTLQFLTYTSQNLLKTYEKTCENLLNGLVEIPE